MVGRHERCDAHRHTKLPEQIERRERTMTDFILTLNAGSSSLKAGLYSYADYQAGRCVARFHVSGIGPEARVEIELDGERVHRDVRAETTEQGWVILFDAISDHISEQTPVAVSHRVVHGGQHYSAPVQVTPAIREALEQLTPLAPLHEPYNLAGIDQARARWPSIPQIACFDTGFHRTQPDIAQRYAIPNSYFDDGVLRYGFHGLSYEYIAGQIPELFGDRPSDRVIVAHLGSGVSMCALKDRKSIATTMGFTALAGLPMSTRCGDIDPGVLLYLQEIEGVSTADLAHMLQKQSGLLGLSGISGDMRTLEHSDDPGAQRAIAYFVYQCQRAIGSLTAALGGLDGLIFTAGIGENSSLIREQIIAGLDWLGCRIDADRNAQQAVLIGRDDSEVSLWALPTNEEAMLAKHAADCLK